MSTDDFAAAVVSNVIVEYADRSGAGLRNMLRPKAFRVSVSEFNIVEVERRSRRTAYQMIYVIQDATGHTTYPNEQRPFDPQDLRKGAMSSLSGNPIPAGSVVTLSWIDRRRKTVTFRVPPGAASFPVFAKLNEMTRRERRRAGL